MSVYDHRDKPAYSNFSVKPSYCRNSHILKWWTEAHDQLIVEQIEKTQWHWYWGITDEIIEITPPEIIEDWQQKDPLCLKYAWYNVLMYFAAARGQSLGLTNKIRKPKWKTCPLCNQKFIEDSLPVPLVENLGIDQLDFCAPCLSGSLSEGSDSLSKGEVLNYLQDLADMLQQVPNQNFGNAFSILKGLDFQERLLLLQILKRKPTTNRVKELFGSWLNALIQAGILEDGTRRTSRGTQCLAKDGHVCLSLGEKTIDDFLFNHKIPHEKEPRYPEGNYRADFLVGDAFIEYFGLKGNPEYDAKTKLKQRICKKHSVQLISIYPGDLVSIKELERKLLSVLSQDN